MMFASHDAPPGYQNPQESVERAIINTSSPKSRSGYS